ncbi:MerR family transcriptional regulator [Skermania sp. ID1734]|uniref:MerR family transcriptional regulator n=1 Tax=Skermania sp. ID1734 TaxID=2597516 RepID=UPI00117D37B6|nr:MerR family transcriptional regulator [Skermania sp. ID1734]TSD93957.1 MerR family transcriptional regulator [Skermania sp. ID1734]
MTGLRISELASRSGVPVRTLRYYETIGLVRPQRDPNGYRRYGSDDVERLGFVAGAKRLGLRLDEIAELLALRTDGCAAVRDRLEAVVAARLAESRRSIVELEGFEKELVRLAGALEATTAPAECGDGCGCPDHPVGDVVPCSLTGSEFDDRADEWRHVVTAAIESREVADGWVLRFCADPALASRIAALAVAEQRCCPFFAFRIEVRDVVELTVSVPGEARDAVTAMFAFEASGTGSGSAASK